MTPKDAVEWFGSQAELARVCDISEVAVSHWMRKGWIPYDKQCQIQLESAKRPRGRRRRLTASKDDIPEREAA